MAAPECLGPGGGAAAGGGVETARGGRDVKQRARSGCSGSGSGRIRQRPTRRLSTWMRRWRGFRSGNGMRSSCTIWWISPSQMWPTCSSAACR